MKLNFKSVLMLGVGGVSMHQMALAFKSLGIKVYGYDAKESKYTKLCKQNGIEVTKKFKPEFCLVDICVKTAAIKDDNKYIKQLKKLNVKIVDRAKMLAQLCSTFKNVIAVAGTHGKSTTASLIYEILRSSGKKVSCHIGADVFMPKFNLGDDYLVLEACEYNKSFLNFFPNISVVTNVEAEHMDSYSSLFCLKNSFLTFLKRAEKRYVFDCSSTKYLNKYHNINFVKDCNLNIKPKLVGDYNRNNIALAVKVCLDLGVSKSNIIKVVNNFKGVPRRFEHIGNVNKTKIFIDYAHHPSEISEFVKAFSSKFKNCLIVFQPHTYSRTKIFFNNFVNVLSSIGNLIIYKEYPARESSDCGYSAKDLFLAIKNLNGNVEYSANLKKIASKIEFFDAVAFVGAGDINRVAEKIVETN